jgi:HJR/Mrr/RecB family endonuclease
MSDAERIYRSMEQLLPVMHRLIALQARWLEMNPSKFEEYVGWLFSLDGYIVEAPLNAGADYGADLILTKGTDKTAVQVKRWSRSVGPKAVREAHTARDYYGLTSSMVVAASQFTARATKLARVLECELIDGLEIASRFYSKVDPAILLQAPSLLDVQQR